MRIGNRLFPYPVLNNDQSLSLYNRSKFTLNYDDVKKTQDKLLIKNVHIVIENHNLNKLIQEDKAQALCIIECSATVFRESYVINGEGKNIEIPLHELNGRVSVSAYVYALEELHDFWDSDFVDDYVEESFDINKYELLAVDDGFTTKVVFDETKDNKVSSIFLVTKKIDNDKNQEMEVSLGDRKISIALPESQFDFYDKFKTQPLFQNLFFTFLIAPSLVYALESLKAENFEHILMEYNWFDSITKAYEEKTGTELDEDELQNESPITIMQKIMDFPITKAFDELKTLIFNSNKGDDDEE